MFSGVSSWNLSSIVKVSNFCCQNGKHAVSFSASLVFGWCWTECIKPQLVFNESRARYLTSNRLTDMLVTLMPICRDVQLGLFLLLVIKVSLKNPFPPQDVWGREGKPPSTNSLNCMELKPLGRRKTEIPFETRFSLCIKSVIETNRLDFMQLGLVFVWEKWWWPLWSYLVFGKR